MATLTELRAKLGSRADAFTDQELFDAASAAYGPMYSDPKILQKELGYDPEWDFGRGLRIGWQGVKAGVAGAGAAAADAVGWQGGRDAALNYGRQQQQQAFQLGRRSDDVDNFAEDPLSFLSSAAGQGLAFAAPSVLGGGLGALGARAVGLRALGGAAAGSYATNLGQETGGIYNELAEQGKFEPGRALLYGAGAAALDTAAEAVPFLGKTTGGLARRVAGGVLKQSGVEAATETGQTAIERAGAYKPLDDAEAWHEYRNAAALGAVGGGMFGGAAGIPGPARMRQPVADPTPGTQTDLLGGAPAWSLQQGFQPQPQPSPEQPLGDLTPDWSTTPGAAPAQPQGMDFSSAYPAVNEPPLFQSSARRGPAPLGEMPGVDMPPLVADEAGAVGADPTSAEALYGRENGDPGVALARQRYLEQVQQNEQRRQTTEAVQAKAQERVELLKRTKEVTGVDGTRAADLFADLERQRDAGLLNDLDFQGDAALISTREFGKVAKNIKTRDKAAQEQGDATDAGGTGQPGPADAGRGAGSQRAPEGRGDVRPAAPGAAAQAVPGAGAVQLGPRDPGGNTALSPVIGSKAADAPARAAKMVGRELSPAEQTVVKRLANATPRDQAIMRDLLGMDAEGHQVNEPLTYEQIGAKYTNDTGKNKGKPMTRAGVQAVLKKLGLTEEVADAIRAGYSAPVSAEELGISQQDRAEGGEQNASGFRVTDKAGAGQDDFQLDARTVQAQAATDEAIAAAGEEARVAAEQAIAARKAVTDTEFDAKRQAQADAQRAAPAPKRIKTVQDYLKRALDEGNIQPVDIEDAAAEYDQFVQNDPDGGIPWSELTASMQADWVGQYIKYQDQVSKDKRQAEQSYASAWMESQDEAAKRPRANRSSVLPGSAGAAPQESAAGRALPSNAAAAEAVQGADAADEDLSWGDEAAQMSRAGGRDENTTYHTADSLEDSLLAFMNADSLGRRVVIVETAADLKSTEDMLAGFDETAVAWARDGRAYLIADRIPVGQERGVFLHEVGGHLGLQRVLGQKEFDRLVSQIVGWSVRKDNSQEATLARKARERVDQAGEDDPTQRQNELVAYFLEEAVNAGVNPTSLKYDTPLAQWMRTLWAAFKVALRKLGINPDKLTAQDVVDLGYGAARLTTTGRYHGTAAKVQQFRTKYIGTGEGAQAYGWGLYFSELKGVADEYKRQDEKRKGGGATGGNKDAKDFPMWAELKDLATGHDLLGFDSLGEMLREYLRDHKQGKLAQFYDNFPDVDADLRETLRDFGDWWFKPAQKVEGATYATDIAIKDDEFLDWTKPLDEQSATVQRVMRENKELASAVLNAPAFGFERTGGGLYRYLETEEASKDNLQPSGVSAAERASKWLDSIGIKGVRMPVNYQRGGSYAEGRNFVVFNEKNVIKTLVNPENRVSKSIQFSKSVKPADAQALSAAQAAVTEALPAKAKDGWTNARDFFKKNAPYWLTNFQLAEQFGGKIKALKKYVHVADMMRMETVRQQMVFDEVSKRWDSLPKAARKMLDQVALRATMQATHPDLPLDHKLNAHLDEDQKRGYAALAAQYKQMATAHPEAAKVYQDAKKSLEDSRLRMEEASKQLFDAYGIKRTVPAETPGPYFPLMRFGEYLAIGESAEFKAAENELASAQGDARKELQKRLGKLKRDPKHYIVSAHETRSAMERAVADYQNRGLEARANMADQRLEALPKDVHKLVQDLAAKMADQFDPDTAHAVIDAYKDFLVKSLPELHALNRAAQRVGVEGASSDMLRAFAAGGRQNSFYTARLLHAKDSADTMLEMKREVKGNTDLQHVHRELEKRAALDLQFKDTPIQDMIGTLGWVYYLGVSPTFLFMNTTQPWLVTAPVLAGKYGLSKSTKALAQASREALAVLKDARWKDGKWSPWEGISEESVKTTRKNAEGVSEDRKALRALMQRGIVDEGLQHELRTFAEGGNRTLAKFGRWTGWASQQIELVNRTSTALATFRLARDQGMSYDEAVEEAYRVTTNTQIDYSAEGTARFMREGGGIPFAKLFFQFRRYQQTMLYVLGDNIKKLANPAERKVAAKSLAYFALTSGLAAGAMGLPFAGSIMLIANAFMDDDDEDGDAETRLRNLLFDLTGDRAAANVLAKGIPAMFNADLSQRIGLGQIAQLYPRLELNGRTGEENIGKVVANVAGPAAGLAAQFFQAGILFGNGDWMKGTEKLVPKAAADGVRAWRYYTQGMTDSKGEQILGPDEIKAWDIALRALGTTAVSEANYYEGTKALRSVEQATNDRKTKIRMEFRRALRSGDFEDVRAMIDEFNADHPASPIKPKEELAWRKEAAKAGAQRGEDGIKFNPKRDAKYGELMRFARE